MRPYLGPSKLDTPAMTGRHMGLTGRKETARFGREADISHYPPRDTVSALDQINGQPESPGLGSVWRTFSFFLLILKQPWLVEEIQEGSQ